MKLQDIDWTPNKKYYADGIIFTVDEYGSELDTDDDYTNIIDIWNLKYISSEAEFEEYINWNKIPKDTLVLVNFNGTWEQRYFARKTSDTIFVYPKDKNSITIENNSDVCEVSYENIKLYKE